MKRKERYSPSDKREILKELEEGKSVEDMYTDYGIDQARLDQWRQEIDSQPIKKGLKSPNSKEMARLKQLENENTILRKVVADLHIQMAQKR